MEMRQVINYPGDDIEAGEIKFRELVVEEELLHNPDLCVERLGDARLIHQSDPGSDQDIILFAAANERGIRGPVKGRVNGKRERPILLRPLQDLLLADVLLVRTRDGITLSFTSGRSCWDRQSALAEQLRARLRRAGRCLALCWLTCENQRRYPHKSGPSEEKFRKMRQIGQSWRFF